MDNELKVILKTMHSLGFNYLKMDCDFEETEFFRNRKYNGVLGMFTYHGSMIAKGSIAEELNEFLEDVGVYDGDYVEVSKLLEEK